MVHKNERLRKIVKETYADFNSLQCADIVKRKLHPSQPVRDFEKATGLTGLSRQYVMPLGRSPQQTELNFELVRLENYVSYDWSSHQFAFMSAATPVKKQLYLSYTNKLIHELRRLNPELRAIPLDRKNVDQSVDFILGVTGIPG